MGTPIPFPLHEHLQRLLGITARSWGLDPRQRRVLRHAPRAGFAISY
ncbi:MAG: hypothetical protein RBS27_09570 [Giesbergeria sp.]|jgi:hypothetical protein|nr:hypothetical protein [Giesbergeria sp.]